MKAKKEKKAPKPARMYRKSIPEKKFQKKFLGMIEQKADKELLASSFERKDGRYSIKKGIGRDSMLKLNKLAKAIKSNRGMLKAGPIIALSLLIGGPVIFGLVLMNPILESALEAALQGLFDAKAEVTALRFEPLKMRIGIAALSVADENAPMTNLFETKRIALSLNPSAMLRGKIYVEEAAVESLAFGTARKSSGALPKKEASAATAAAAAAKERKSQPPLVDFANFDAKALLQSQKESLKSKAAYEKADAAYQEAASRWKAKVENSEASVSSLKSSSGKALAIDVGAIKTPSQAASAIKDVKAAIEDARKVVADTDAVYSGITKDSENLKKLNDEAKSAYSEDLAYMKSLVNPRSGAASSALEPVLKDVLSDSGERYLNYARRALEVAERLNLELPKKGSKQESEAEAKKKNPEAPKGRDVVYPSGAYPSFRLGRLYSDFSAKDWNWKIEILELSSQPDLVNKATKLSVQVKGKGKEAKAEGIVDLRGASKEKYSLKASCSGIPFDLGETLSSAGLSGFSGTLAADATMSGNKDASSKAFFDVDVGSPRVAKASGALGSAIAKAIATTKAVEARVAVSKSSGGKESFSLKTNLDKIVLGAIADMGSQEAKKAMADIEKEMKSYYSDELEGKLDSKVDFDALLAAAKGDKAAGDEIAKSLDAKLAELEKKAKSAAADALPKVKLPKLP